MTDEELLLVRLLTRVTAQRETVMTARDGAHPAGPGAPALSPTLRRLRGPPVPVGISC
jgi:hypothetical protein